MNFIFFMSYMGCHPSCCPSTCACRKSRETWPVPRRFNSGWTRSPLGRYVAWAGALPARPSQRRGCLMMGPPLLDRARGHWGSQTWSSAHGSSAWSVPDWSDSLLEAIICLANTGGTGFLEHPQFPLWAVHKDPASIWQSREVRMLRTLVYWHHIVRSMHTRKPSH